MLVYNGPYLVTVIFLNAFHYGSHALGPWKYFVASLQINTVHFFRVRIKDDPTPNIHEENPIN